MAEEEPPKEERLTAEAYKARKKAATTTEKKSLWKFPDLGRDRRKDLVERLHEGANWNFSFGLLTALSTTIASLGLIQGSSATVIGAMVVAPLMLPLIAAGLSLVQGNVILFRTSAKTMLRGVLLALLASFVIGLVIPQSDLSSELIARAAPNILDLGVAFLAGFAAAYAVALPELLGALAGVAIAVALVPPLATTGIAIADGIWPLAYGAGLLFVTNLVAIILGAASVFQFLGISKTSESQTPKWVRKTVSSLVLGGLLLTGLLGYKFIQQLTHGQNRPLSYPLTREVVFGIEDYLENHRNVRFVVGGRRITPDGHVRLMIFLSSNRAISEDFQPQFVKHLQELFGGEPDVDLHIFQEVAGSEATSYSADSKGIKSRE